MYGDVLQELGLSKNEAKIYQTLLQEGKSSAYHISNQSKINRRNVYDSLKRLIEKGLVFEIVQKKEGLYQAVDPRKLNEFLEEKQQILTKSMPGLLLLYEKKAVMKKPTFTKGSKGIKMSCETSFGSEKTSTP